MIIGAVNKGIKTSFAKQIHMISYPLNIIFLLVSGFGVKVIESDKERPNIVITRKAYDLLIMTFTLIRLLYIVESGLVRYS